MVLLVSGGVSLLFSGQKHDNEVTFPMYGFLLTLLSGMLAGLKWTLSQVSGAIHVFIGSIVAVFQQYSMKCTLSRVAEAIGLLRLQ